MYWLLDIEIKQILVVSLNESHSRFDALSRTYEYRISTTKAPFDQLISHLCCWRS